MDIKNQIRLSVLISILVVAIISVSIGLSYQTMLGLQQQESRAAEVVRGGYELTYLSNNYIINAEPRARIQWEERYDSLQPVIAGLQPSTVEERKIIESIRDYNEKIGTLFREIPNPDAGSPGTPQFSPELQQITWSRTNVQSQGMLYEAWILRHLYNDDVSRARFWNNILVLALMGSLLVIITVNYLLISRRLVRSIEEVNSGSTMFATGNLAYRIPVSSDDEIGGIARGLNRMAGQLQSVTASREELEREIAERIRAEETLKRNEALLKRTGEIARVGGWELDAATKTVLWTEETYNIHEVPVGHMPPLVEAINFFHPDERQRLSDAIERAFATNEGYDMELRFITAKGRHLWTRTVCKPEIVDGKVVRLIDQAKFASV
jgi:PAS domain-containing protein